MGTGSRLDYQPHKLTNFIGWKMVRIDWLYSRQQIIPVLKQLHWLSVRQHIFYKLLLLLVIFWALRRQVPQYLDNQLRSPHNLSLCVAWSNSRYGDRMFAVSALHIWNILPLTVKSAQTVSSFKKSLEIYLFQQTYDWWTFTPVFQSLVLV